MTNQNDSALHIGMVDPNLTLCKGGVENVCSKVANAMVDRGHRVTIFCADPGQNAPAYPLDARIRLQFFDSDDGHSNISAIRKFLQSLDIDVCVSMQSFREQLFWAVVLLGSGVPFIYSEHTSPDVVERFWSRAGRLAAMSGADAIRLLSQDFIKSLPDFLQERAICIPNCAPDVTALNLPKASINPPFILTSLGRITPEKQIHMLIRAFEIIHSKFSEWELHIWGKDSACELANLVRNSPARAVIRLCGHTDRALHVFSLSHLVCVPSIYEGVPNTILESFACGVPVVGFAACPGVKFLIQDGVNGLLASDMSVENLAEKLAVLMGNNELRLALGQGALQSAKRFPQKVFLDQWEDLFRKIAACKGYTRMDAFADEPFASMARLSAAARREWLYRDFGKPFPLKF